MKKIPKFSVAHPNQVLFNNMNLYSSDDPLKNLDERCLLLVGRNTYSWWLLAVQQLCAEHVELTADSWCRTSL
jgi:hypothetical protein